MTAVLLPEWNFGDNVILVIFSHFSVWRARPQDDYSKLNFNESPRNRHDIHTCAYSHPLELRSYVQAILQVRLIAKRASERIINTRARFYKFSFPFPSPSCLSIHWQNKKRKCGEARNAEAQSWQSIYFYIIFSLLKFLAIELTIRRNARRVRLVLIRALIFFSRISFEYLHLRRIVKSQTVCAVFRIGEKRSVHLGKSSEVNINI